VLDFPKNEIQDLRAEVREVSNHYRFPNYNDWIWTYPNLELSNKSIDPSNITAVIQDMEVLSSPLLFAMVNVTYPNGNPSPTTGTLFALIRFNNGITQYNETIYEWDR
jgi:hypothetical protein